jgi:hypothetical protein
VLILFAGVMRSLALPWWHHSGASGHPMVPVPQPAGIAFQFLEAYNSFQKKDQNRYCMLSIPHTKSEHMHAL